MPQALRVTQKKGTNIPFINARLSQRPSAKVAVGKRMGQGTTQNQTEKKWRSSCYTLTFSSLWRWGWEVWFFPMIQNERRPTTCEAVLCVVVVVVARTLFVFFSLPPRTPPRPLPTLLVVRHFLFSFVWNWLGFTSSTLGSRPRWSRTPPGHPRPLR